MTHFIETTIPEDHLGRRLDRFLKHYFLDLSQGQIEKLLRSKMIRLDGKKAHSDTRINEDSLLRYPDFLQLNIVDTAKEKTPIFPQEIILYEDQDLMVINKPHGLASQGGSNMKMHLDLLLDTLPKRNGFRPSTVHRLDKDTSGCLVIAKKRTIAAKLGEALKMREFEKYYLAITDKNPRNDNGFIENHLVKTLSKQAHSRELMQITAPDTPKAQLAQSAYISLDSNMHDKKSLLLLSPITGRTHQLRVHCQAIGAPIIGDGKYNPSSDIKSNLCLHAVNIIFSHPVTDKIMDIEAPMPEHFHRIAKNYQLSLKNTTNYVNKEMLKRLL